MLAGQREVRRKVIEEDAGLLCPHRREHQAKRCHKHRQYGGQLPQLINNIRPGHRLRYPPAEQPAQQCGPPQGRSFPSHDLDSKVSLQRGMPLDVSQAACDELNQACSYQDRALYRSLVPARIENQRVTCQSETDQPYAQFRLQRKIRNLLDCQGVAATAAVARP